jgi:hypothetical protein
MISKRVWPALKAAGFTRSSGTFRLRSAAGDAIVLEFQGSQGSGGNVSLFYLNMAACTGDWLRWQESRGYERAFRLPGTALGQWWARLEPAPGFDDGFDRWRLASVTDAERCGDLLAAALPERALPLIEENLERYRRIDASLRAGEILLPPVEPNVLGGHHFLRKADHPYLVWAHSASKAKGAGPGPSTTPTHDA